MPDTSVSSSRSSRSSFGAQRLASLECFFQRCPQVFLLSRKDCEEHTLVRSERFWASFCLLFVFSLENTALAFPVVSHQTVFCVRICLNTIMAKPIKAYGSRSLLRIVCSFAALLRLHMRPLSIIADLSWVCRYERVKEAHSSGGYAFNDPAAIEEQRG
jgi:hypothetical protein